ncbi:three-helix bundle dimerization domain-containing protein [Streptomyces qaidamensis]|uniref:three-helix bundle dimerization domain-containing protein n=1 Tax=Streptomyces qaidamensis TaxID=1783515 RepID=UPI002FF8EC62
MTASPPPVLPDERLASGIARLALRYRGRFSPETVQRLVTDSYERLAEHARIPPAWSCWPSTWPPSGWTRSRTSRALPAAACHGCCSCAATTPDARRWPPPPCSHTARADRWSYRPQARSRPPRSSRSSPRC